MILHGLGVVSESMEHTIHSALEQFEATEANLSKLETLCADIERAIPSGIVFGADPAFENKCRAAEAILPHLPAIEGWKPDLTLPDLDGIAQTRLDIAELDEPGAEISFERSLEEPSRQLREYRFRFDRARRKLVRDAIDHAIDQVDAIIREMRPRVEGLDPQAAIPDNFLNNLRTHYKEINTLLGSSIAKPDRWGDMDRHLHFGQIGDFHDIESIDWPVAKASLRKNLYGQDDPLPVAVADLSELLVAKPRGPIPIKLNWKQLSDENFERLVFALISAEPGYENPEWLMNTHAADRGRDLSVRRVTKDGLSGHRSTRVVIQCKHWQGRSIAPTDVALLKEQMLLWEPPRVDVLVIATSGRFTADAVAAIEKHEQSDRAMRIEMWPESHLEMLLAARPHLIAEFGLR